MPSVYKNISENKRKTWIVMLLFMVVFVTFGWFIGEYYYGGYGYSFIGVAFIFSGISSLVSYYFSDKMVLGISKAQKLPKDESPQLHDLVENMCIASGQKTIPEIYIIYDSAPNAFATGRSPEHSAMCFTTGLIHKLDKRELEGVIAHELSHIQNYDILLMSVVSIMVGTITLVADFLSRGVLYGRRRRSSSSSGPLAIVGLVLIILSPIIATLIKLAISRKREFLADASAVMKTRYPKGLADALAKIATDTEPLEAANGATAHLYISNPLKNDKHPSIFAKLFNTHPPVDDRIKRLMEM